MPTKRVPLENYEVQFHRLLAVEPARENLKTYLKSQLTEELLLFLVAVDETKLLSDTKEQAAAVRKIYEDYVKIGSPHELNISNREREKVTQLLSHHKQFETEELVVPITIFDETYKLVRRELREDSVARYLRSKTFQQFVNEMGEEFLNTIAVDISMQEYSDVMLVEEDFRQKGITQKDVDFFVKLLGDSPGWQALTTNKDHDCYTSRTRYCLAQDYKPQLLKVQGFLPGSAYEGLLGAIDPIVLKQINPFDKSVRYLDSSDDGEYASVLRHAVLKTTPFQEHDLYSVETIVYEPSTRCYMLIVKTTDAYQDKYPLERKAFRVMHCSAFFEVSETKCRYVNLSWIDMRLYKSRKMQNFIDTVFGNAMCKMRAKGTHKGYTFAIKEMSKYNYLPNRFEGDRSTIDTLEEFFRRNPDKDPRRRSAVNRIVEIPHDMVQIEL